jgi:hypothetical protein
MSPARDESAKALLELILVLPFIVLVAFASFDASDSLRAHQYLSTIVRELGTGAYRSCLEVVDGTAMNACLQQAAGEVVQYANGTNGVLPDVKVGVSLYRVRFSGATALTPTLAGQYWSSNTVQSRYTTSVVGSLNSYIAAKGAIVTVEAFSNKQGWTSYFTRQLYETAVF